jgi:hypothetical protein
MHEYSKLIELLLDLMKNDKLVALHQESLSTLLLIASKVAPNYKIIIGDLNAIERILEMIIFVHNRRIIDGHNLTLMNYFWAILCSLTGDNL